MTLKQNNIDSERQYDPNPFQTIYYETFTRALITSFKTHLITCLQLYPLTKENIDVSMSYHDRSRDSNY